MGRSLQPCRSTKNPNPRTIYAQNFPICGSGVLCAPSQTKPTSPRLSSIATALPDLIERKWPKNSKNRHTRQFGKILAKDIYWAEIFVGTDPNGELFSSKRNCSPVSQKIVTQQHFDKKSSPFGSVPTKISVKPFQPLLPDVPHRKCLFLPKNIAPGLKGQRRRKNLRLEVGRPW